MTPASSAASAPPPAPAPAPRVAQAAVDAPVYRGRPILGIGPQLLKDPLGLFFDLAALGDVVRTPVPLFPHELILVRHPDAVQRVLVDNVKNYTKDTKGYWRLADFLGAGLVTSDGDFWKRQRRIANPAFHRERIGQFCDTMVRCGREMLDRWEPRLQSGQPFDVAREMMGVALRVIGLTMLSSDVEGTAADVAWALDDVLHVTIDRILRLFTFPPPVPTSRNRRFAAGLRKIDGILNGIIAERRRTGGDEGDLLSMLMNARDPETGEGMTDQQLRDEAMTMFLAGHETTANLLSWTVMLLSRHPDVARKLRAEVEARLGSREPKLEDLAALPYTEQVLKESLRLYPPVWSVSRFVVEEDAIGGFRIPKGRWVFLSSFLSHRDPRFWPNPEGFDPDRFLPALEASRPKGAYFPFLAGPRKCLGETFALMEAKLLLAMIVQRAELALVPGFRLELDPTVTLRPKNGIWVTGRRVSA